MPSVSKKAEQKRKALLCGPASGTRKVHDKNVLTIVGQEEEKKAPG